MGGGGVGPFNAAYSPVMQRPFFKHSVPIQYVAGLYQSCTNLSVQEGSGSVEQP